MRDFHRRAGAARRLTAWSLLAVPAALLVALVVALAGGAAPASGAGPGLQPLHGRQGQVPPGATSLGPAPSSTVLPLTVTLQPRDPTGLAAEAAAVSDPASPRYHHFLTPRRFAARYGPTPATIEQVTAALRSAGLSVGAPSATGLSLPVSGRVAQVQSAFSTPIDRYKLSSGKTGYRNSAVPKLPASVAPQVEGIIGLDTLSPPRPTASLPLPAAAPGHGVGPSSPVIPPAPAPAGSAAAVAPAGSAGTPALASGQPAPAAGNCATSISTVQSTYGALDAPQLAQAYSFGSPYSSGDYGAGTTVALVELSGAGYSTNDIAAFAACYGISLSSGQVTQRVVSGGGATGRGTVEAELDIETVLSMAPKADIEVYEGGPSADLYDVLSSVVNDDSAKIVSVSWTNGCEAYVGSAMQNAENTLLQTAAVDGQSVFVASGDQGSEGCNVNGVISAPTGGSPVAQAVDTATGTLYVANRSGNTLSVDGEGTTTNPSGFSTAGSVTTGTAPDAVALASGAGKVFVANASSSSLTAVSTSTCNQANTSGCASPTQVASGGHLSGPTALAADGSTLYVGNANGTVAVYNAGTDAYVATVALPTGSVPSALTVDTGSGVAYVADGANNRIAYFDTATCNAGVTTGCATTPSTVAVGNDPVGLAVDDAVGNLYVANAGSGGGVSVVSLSTHTVTTTVSTGQPSVTGLAGTGVVRSVALSPDGRAVLAVLDGLSFPGDVLATIDPTTGAITATVNLQTGSDTMGALVSDSSRNLVWVTDQTAGDDVVQNLNLGVSDPASQPMVTSVGGTSISALGPAPTESTWNDQLHYAEGAGGGGISRTFAMPAFQQSLGTVAGSSGTPCGNVNGDCREVPDVSADADPSTGYVIYDSVNGYGWTAIGGTSGAAPLWAAVLAVASSADGNTVGFGDLNPILYELAQKSPGTYLNDVTTGNNDLNGTDGQQFAATSGYDMATGLGTPVTSALATGLSAVPLDVAVSGTQPYGGSPTFTATPDFGGSTTMPYGVVMVSAGFTCTEVGTSTTISPSLPVGSNTLVTSSCSGISLSGANAGGYNLVLTSATGDFTVSPAPVQVSVSGTQTYGGSPSFTASASSPPSGVTVDTSAVTCTEVEPFKFITPGLAAGSYTLFSGSCSGVTLSGTDAADYAPFYVSTTGNFPVAPASLTVTGSSPAMTYGSAPPTITPLYSGFVNGDTGSSLSTQPTCSTTATQTSPVSGSPYPSSCSGAVDPNYVIGYSAGFVTVTRAPLTVTASSPTMTYGSAPPTIAPLYSGFVNGDTPAVLSTQPTCSTTATSTSTPSTYPSSCSGGSAANYALSDEPGSVTVGKALLTVTASSGTMPYGSAPPAITASYNGFVNGDGQSSLSALPSCTTVATSGSGVAGSPYATSCSGAAAADYTFSYVAGTVTVTRMPLTVTASDGTMTYGSAPPAITPLYSGFVNGDTGSSLSTQPACSTTATQTSPVSGSPYPSSCSGAADPNYSITDDPGTVTLTRAPLTVTASSPTMTYGSAPPTIAPLYSGFVNGDSASSSLGTQPTCSTTATSTSTPSTYPSSCSGGSATDYVLSFQPGLVSVMPAPITVTVVGSQNYGSAPTFTGTTTTPPVGVTVDAGSITCSQVAPSTTITPGMVGGSYTLVPGSCRGATLSGSSAGDYVVVYVAAAGNFSVFGGPPTPPPPAPHGYWLVGSDGGIFTFGSAHFFGSTGSLRLQRPVVGITPTADQGGYWLVASDGGIFAFGDAGFFGSIPGLGLGPAGSGPHALNAPIVGMVPSADGGGYFMVASDGGVFAFGDAQFEGSCPGIGGCSGAAVSVVPDASGRGYWLVTRTGNVYTFGDAPYYGAPGPQASPITAAVRSADGAGYYVLLADGTVDGFGDAVPRGGPVGAVGGLSPASAIFTDKGGGGYWVASATGAVFTYGDAPADGSMAGTPLNGAIIAGTGF